MGAGPQRRSPAHRLRHHDRRSRVADGRSGRPVSGPQSTGGPVCPDPPEPPEESRGELVKALYEAQLAQATSRWRGEIEAAQRRRDDERRLQDQAAAVEDTLREAVHAAY